MALALNNLKRVDMTLNKETKPKKPKLTTFLGRTKMASEEIDPRPHTQ